VSTDTQSEASSELEGERDSTSAGSAYVIGKHLYGNFYGVDRALLGSKEFVEEAVLEAAKATGATIVEMKSWVMGGPKGGVSVILLVTESHLAIHTWVEYGYATIDIYTCGDHTEPKRGFQVLLEKFKPKKYVVHYVVRDSRSEEMKLLEELAFPPAD